MLGEACTTHAHPMHNPCTRSVPEPAAVAGTPAARIRQSAAGTRGARAVRPSRFVVNHRYQQVFVSALRFFDQANHRLYMELSGMAIDRCPSAIENPRAGLIGDPVDHFASERSARPPSCPAVRKHGRRAGRTVGRLPEPPARDGVRQGAPAQAGAGRASAIVAEANALASGEAISRNSYEPSCSSRCGRGRGRCRGARTRSWRRPRSASSGRRRRGGRRGRARWWPCGA
jgi:hypothetical protein